MGTPNAVALRAPSVVSDALEWHSLLMEKIVLFVFVLILV